MTTDLDTFKNLKPVIDPIDRYKMRLNVNETFDKKICMLLYDKHIKYFVFIHDICKPRRPHWKDFIPSLT